jgi:hypothetical protein
MRQPGRGAKKSPKEGFFHVFSCFTNRKKYGTISMRFYAALCFYDVAYECTNMVRIYEFSPQRQEAYS